MKDEKSDYNFQIIKKQLGRTPNNLIGVARECPFGYPAVLITNPYEDGIVFPTTYWLSCPFLVKELGKIEDTGIIKDLTDRLKNDRELRKKLELAHKNYAEKRLSYLNCDLDNLSEGIKKVITTSGVGGIVDKEGIKCLHTHLADYLVNGENPIGRIAFKKVDWPDNCMVCEEFLTEIKESN